MDANNKFLMGPSNQASVTFIDRRQSILSSLQNGTRDDDLYPRIVEVLSKAELFLCAVLPDEEALFEELYDTAVQEARRRKIAEDERRLLAAKSLRHWAWFSPSHQTWDPSLYAGCNSDADAECPAKLVCYHAAHQFLSGNLDEGVSLFKRGFVRLNDFGDELVLKFHIFLLYHDHLQGHQFDDGMELHVENFESLGISWFQARLPSMNITEISLENESEMERLLQGDLLFFISLYRLTQNVLKEKDGFQFANILCRISPELCRKLQLGAQHIPPWVIIVGDLVKDPQSFQLPELEGSLCDKKYESLHLRLQEFTEETLQNGPESAKSCNASLLLFESLLHFLKEDNKFKQLPDFDFVDLARFYDRLGEIKYSFKSDANGAIELHQQAIMLREENVGDHLDTVSSLEHIGSMYLEINKTVEATAALENALRLRKRLGAQEDADTSSVYFTLGENHYTLKDYGKACKAHVKALRLREKHLGEDALTAQSFFEVGRVYFAMESYPEALGYCQKSLAIRLQLLGEHEDTATSYNLLGSLHFKKGDNMSAVQAFEVAADMRSNVLGDHKDTANSYHNLGVVQRALGNLPGAFESFKKAFQLREVLLGEDDPDTAKSLKLLIRVHEALSSQESNDL